MRSGDFINPARNEEPLVRIGDGVIDRMPGLSGVFQEVGVLFGKFLGNFVDDASVVVDEFRAMRLGDLAEQCVGFGRHYVFRECNADFRAVVLVDSVFCGLLFELLLGAGIVEIDSERPSTRIDDQVIAFAALKIAGCFSQSFARFGRFSLVRDASAEEAGLLALGSKAAVFIATKVSLQCGPHQAEALILLPRAAFDPYRLALSRPPDAGGGASDESWAEKLYENIVSTEVRAEVRIEAKGFTLGDVARFEAGDVLRLPAAPTDLIRVVSENRTLFWCTLGQKDGKYTIRLEEFSNERESYIENILGV